MRATSTLLTQRGIRHEWSHGDDPPDFWLSIDGARLAVEVTQIMHQFKRRSLEGSEAGIRHGLRRAGESLLSAMAAEGLLSGDYVLHMEPVEKLRNAISEIETNLRSFLLRTYAISAAEKCILYGRAWGERWTIEKLDTGWVGVHYSISLSGIGLEQGHVRRMLRELLIERVTSKNAKLAHTSEPAILVLAD